MRAFKVIDLHWTSAWARLTNRMAFLTSVRFMQARGILRRRVWDSRRCASSISGAEKVMAA